MASILWVGGTGANIAMSFFRMQWIRGLGKEPFTQIKHHIIDTKNNVVDKFDKPNKDNIAINTYYSLGINKEEHALFCSPISESDASTLNNYFDNDKNKKSKVLFDGIDDFPELIGDDSRRLLDTDIMDGCYRRPIIASLMISSDGDESHIINLNIDELDDEVIICGSSFGGTGAGVIPALALKILQQKKEKGKQPSVRIVYLNFWLEYGAKNGHIKTLEGAEQSNQAANIQFLDRLSDKNNLSYHIYQVDGKYRIKTGNDYGAGNNTTIEIPSPFTYYCAQIVQEFLSSSAGSINPDGKGSEKVLTIGKNGLSYNDFICAAFNLYQYLLKRKKSGFNKKINQFRFSESLLYSTDLKGKELYRYTDEANADAKINWNTDSLKYDTKVTKSFDKHKGIHDKAREGVQVDLYSAREGFACTPKSDSDHHIQHITSFPTVFAQYEFLKTVLQGNTKGISNDYKKQYNRAYLTLIALVISKNATLTYDPSYQEELHIREQIDAEPTVVEWNYKIIGMAGEEGVYFWPLASSINDLASEYKKDYIQSILSTLYSEKNNDLSDGLLLKKILELFWRNDQDIDDAECQYKLWYNIILIDSNLVGYKDKKHSNPLMGDGVTIQYHNDKVKFLFKCVNKDSDLCEVGLKDYALFRDIANNTINQVHFAEPCSRSEKADKLAGPQPFLVLNYKTVIKLPRGLLVKKLTVKEIFSSYAIQFPKSRLTEVKVLPIKKKWMSAIDLNKSSTYYIEGKLDYSNVYIKNTGFLYELLPYEKHQLDIFISYESNEEAMHHITDRDFSLYAWPCMEGSNKLIPNFGLQSFCLNSKQNLAGEIFSKLKPDCNISDNTTVSTKYNWLLEVDDSWAGFVDISKNGETLAITHQGVEPDCLALDLSYSWTDGENEINKYFDCIIVLPREKQNEFASPIVETMKIGLDFGTLYTCSAIQSGNEKKIINNLNSSNNIASVLGNRKWEQDNYSWIPDFDGKYPLITSNRVVDLGIDNVYKIKDEKEYKNIVPFSNLFTQITIINHVANGKNVKESKQESRIKWREDNSINTYIMLYLLLLIAQHRGKRENPHCKFELKVSFPLKFKEKTKGGIKTIEDLYISYYRDLEKNLQEIFLGNSNDLGISFNLYKNKRRNDAFIEYESYTSIISYIGANNSKDELSIVVDVGAGSTDVAVINKGNRVISMSSFNFAGDVVLANECNDANYELLQKWLRDGEYEELASLSSLKKNIDGFINLICAYTAMLLVAAYKQLPDKEIANTCTIYLRGQSWYFGRIYLEEKQKTVKKMNLEGYLTGLIEYYLRQIVSEDKKGELYTKIYKNDKPNVNIRIHKNPIKNKTSCALGILEDGGHFGTDENKCTFIGANIYKNRNPGSSSAADHIHYEWSKGNTNISDLKGMLTNYICITEQRGDLQVSDPVTLIIDKNYWDHCSVETHEFDKLIWDYDSKRLKRNIVEFYLEKCIAANDPLAYEPMKMYSMNWDAIPMLLIKHEKEAMTSGSNVNDAGQKS